ncbi:MAG TPA: type I-E CRISPR-associated protein Cse1/CasA, partial [Candidatus Stackebrandtia faecavium]|nr:type I-E CRISPR-associated protein Cse1/CasA [Candidatus Stackebrandtia faecavium]
VTDEVFDDALSIEIGVLTAAGRHMRVLIVDVVAETIEACKAVGLFAADIARAAGGDNDIQVARRDAARESAYAAIDQQFREWVHGLNVESDTEYAHRRWHETANRTLKRIQRSLAEAAPPGAIRGRDFEQKRGKKRRLNVGTASTFFNSRLKRALPRAYPTNATKGTATS